MEFDETFLLLFYLRRRKKRTKYISRFLSLRNTTGQYKILLPDLLSDSDLFFNYFRMTKSRFQDLIKHICPLIEHKNTHKLPIDSVQRLCLTLRILASGDSQVSMAYNYRISKASVSLIFKETCRAIWTAMHLEFIPPLTEERFLNISKDFWKMWNYPNCLGAIDGKHIQIVAPPNSGSLYFNYKKHFSTILMAVVDARYLFTFVDIGALGKCSDSTVFSESSFGKMIDNNSLPIPDDAYFPGTSMKSPFVFLADEGFPLSKRIMRPYPVKQMDRDKRIFNYRLSRGRRVVENVFGILSARWRILRRPIEAYTAVDDIIKATVVLHNYLKSTDFKEELSKRYVPPAFVDRDANDGSLVPGDWRAEVESASFGAFKLQFSNNYPQSVSQIRENYKEYFITGAGRVPWQERVVNRGCE